jgi:hypothetical protein
VAVILDSDRVISAPILVFWLFNQMVKSGEGGGTARDAVDIPRRREPDCCSWPGLDCKHR